MQEEEEEDDNEKPEWDDDVVEMEYEEPEDEEVQMHMTYVPADDAGYPDEDEGPINMVSHLSILISNHMLTVRMPTLMESYRLRNEKRTRREKTRLSSLSRRRLKMRTSPSRTKPRKSRKQWKSTRL